jgi:hypothetical protein
VSSRSGKVTKVPFWGALGEASRQVFGQLTKLVRVGWIPFLILTLSVVATQVAYLSDLGPPIAVDGRVAPNLQTSLLLGAIGLAALLLQLFCYCGFVVSWYRHALQAGEDARTERGYGSAYWRVMGYFLLAALVLVIALIPGSIVGGIGMAASRMGGPRSLWFGYTWLGGAVLFGNLCCLLLITRFSLVFPAAAYGNRLGLRASWRRMRGNTWRLIGAFFLIFIVSFAIQVIPTFALNGDAIMAVFSGRPPQFYVPHPSVAIGMGLASRCVLFLSMALGTSITAIFYRDLVLRPGPEMVEVFA